jgi:iron complex transport system substrate-binding protein
VRIVSLLPSATEILALVGGRGMLVGRSRGCDWPDGLEDVPVVASYGAGISGSAASAGSAASGSGGSGEPGEIGGRERQRPGAGGSVCRLDADLLASLRPDVILTRGAELGGEQSCSIDLNAVRAAVRGLSPAPRIVGLNPRTVEDVLDDVLTVGGAAGLHARAAEEVVRLRERLFRAQEFVNPYEDGPVVGFLEWTRPLMVAGDWNVQLIERAGGRHPWNPTVAKETAGAAAGPQQGERVAGRSIAAPPEVFAAMGPELVVIAPRGVGLEGAMVMARELAKEAWWGELPAARKGRVAVVDGNLFSRPGARLVGAFEWLVGLVNGREGLMAEGFPWRWMEGR